MDKKLCLIAAQECLKSYESNQDFGTTEFRVSTVDYNGGPIQVLAIPGTNEPGDWWWNFLPASRDGVKLGAYYAAQTIVENFGRYALPLLIACHSKSGPTGLYLKKKYFPQASCVAFAPARGFRHWSPFELEDTVIFTDPDDLVDKLFFMSFRHPECEFVEADENHFFPSVADHVMKHWVAFLS